jgi:polyphosphate kinase
VRRGGPAYIIIKLNNLVAEEMSDKLYEAGKAGVQIKLLVRGTCSMIAHGKGSDPNISIISIVDRFLEHSRIFLFCHGGNEKIFISSADWMARNLDKRLEVSVPILDKDLQNQIKDVLNIYLNDNVRARIVDPKGKNEYVTGEGKRKIRSQYELYNYYQSLLG